MKKSPVVSSSVATRDGDALTRPPMATYVEPSQRAVIRDAQQPSQSIERDRRDRREKMVLLRPADYLKPEAHAMSDITIFFIGLMAGLTSSGLVLLSLHLGGAAMRDITLVYESLAILERKYQDMAERMRMLEQQRAEDRERLNAHGQLLIMRQYKEDLRKRMEAAT